MNPFPFFFSLLFQVMNTQHYVYSSNFSFLVHYNSIASLDSSIYNIESFQIKSFFSKRQQKEGNPDFSVTCSTSKVDINYCLFVCL